MTLINLPPPRLDEPFPLVKAIYQRLSIRKFTRRPLSLIQLSDILWAGQGKIKSGGRATPSAGAIYPLDILALVCKDGVSEMGHGLFIYRAAQHSLELIQERDLRRLLAVAAVNQDFIRQAPVVLVIISNLSRIIPKYGHRARRYAYIEGGHVAQNIQLMTVVLGLGSVPIGAFYDEHVIDILGTAAEAEPIYIIPIGHPA